jgi:DNA-binding transcriptional LysR family regulator
VNERQLRYALAVRDELSFSRAAERIFVSQSSISEQVCLLEEEIGFALFSRTGRGVQLTEAGRVFLRQAEETVSSFTGLDQLARKLRRGSVSGLSMGMSTSVVQFLFPLIVEALRPAESNLELSVITTYPPHLERLILQEVLDVGFTVQFAPTASHPTLAWHAIAAIDMALFVLPDHRLAGAQEPIDMSVIAREPLITSDPSLGWGLLLQSMFGEFGLTPYIVAVADRPDAMKTLVRSGMGVAILPALVALSEVQSGQLVRLPIKPNKTVSLCLVRQTKHLGTHVESCISKLWEAFRARDWTPYSQSNRETVPAAPVG